MKNKTIKCLKCKREFVAELDSSGVPYKRICPKCKKNTSRYGAGISGRL